MEHSLHYGMDKLLVFIIGSMIGSFLNVCIHRIPVGESVLFPPSHCPKCSKRIKWYDNIPILSYIVLMGRCAHCRRRIPIRYLLVEVLTATLILSLYLVFGISAKFFVYSAFTSALVVATFIDFAISEIPDSVSLGGLAAGIIISPIFPELFNTVSRMDAFMDSITGALAGGLTIYAMGVIGKLIFKKEAMGGGDVKLMAMIGAFLGWKLALFTFFIAPIFGASVGLFMKIRDGRETIAYGPYLSLAAVISIFFSKYLLGLLV